MKKTAVEWLVEQLMPKVLTAEQYYHIEKAKKMEKEQIEKAFDDGYAKSGITHNAQEYYNETFKQQEQ